MPQVTNFVRDKDKFYTAIGCEDLIGVPEYAVRTNFNKKEFNAPFIKKLEAIFATKTADEWCEIFKGFDLCYEKLYTYEEVLVDEQAIVNDYIYTMDYPEGRSFKTIRTAIRSDNTGRCEIKRGPMLGENTVEIMQKVGYGEDEINALIAKGTVSQHA